MSHSCASMLCTTPHDPSCTCDVCQVCHESHDWREWAIWPECPGCLRDMAQYIHEETDFAGCPIPEYCDYRPACDEQYQVEHYGKIVRPAKRVA